MRKAWTLKQAGHLGSYMKQVKDDLAECLIEGGLFILNIDDSPECKFNSKFDPCLYEFYDNSSLPIQLLKYNELKSVECFGRVVKDSKKAGSPLKLHRRFFVILLYIGCSLV